MARIVVAWDIETAPQPLDALSDRQRRRHDQLLEDEIRQAATKGRAADPDELSREVRSIHPMLGWICCVSVLRGTQTDDGHLAPGTPKSYAHHLPAGEDTLLTSLWADLARLPRNTLWVTFNGKRFDADWLRVRSAAHGLTPSRHDILDRYPYRHEPHCDLARVFDCRAGLDDLCDLLGIESPKGEMTGAGVAEAVQTGRLVDVARYCEADVAATLECYARLKSQL